MIVLTGGTGFVGQRIVNRLSDQNLVLIGRNKPQNLQHQFYEAEIGPETDYSEVLGSVSVVIHCAARAHVMNEAEVDPLTVYRSINTQGTLNLARQAASAGVKRFIFISSIKVNGEETNDGEEFNFDDSPNPLDPYGISKAEAEQGLMELANRTGMAVVIIRPPLVYGRGVKANFQALMNIARKNLPLPLGSISNKRSLVYVDNLVDLISTCIEHPKAENQIFLVSDDDDLSTSDLLRKLTLAAGKQPRLISFPAGLLRFGITMLGEKSIADRLFGSLQVNISHTKETLGWRPPVTVDDALRDCFE